MAIKSDGSFKVEYIDILQRTASTKKLFVYFEQPLSNNEDGSFITVPTGNNKGSMIFKSASNTAETPYQGIGFPYNFLPGSSTLVGFSSGLGLWNSVDSKMFQSSFKNEEDEVLIAEDQDNVTVYYSYVTTIILGPLTDSKGKVLTYTIIDQPTKGQLYKNDDTKTNAINFVSHIPGPDSFTFSFTNGKQTSNIATISIIVY